MKLLPGWLQATLPRMGEEAAAAEKAAECRAGSALLQGEGQHEDRKEPGVFQRQVRGNHDFWIGSPSSAWAVSCKQRTDCFAYICVCSNWNAGLCGLPCEMSNLNTMSPLLLSENIRFQQFPLLLLSFNMWILRILITAESRLSCLEGWRARYLIFTISSNVIFTSEPYCSYRFRASFL